MYDERHFNYYLGIFSISIATLLLEVSFTRIFAVMFFNHYAFMMISSALFGFAISGVVLSIFSSIRTGDLEKTLAFCSICFSVSVLILLKIIGFIPLRFSKLGEEPSQIVNLALYLLFSAVPFFFSGLALGLAISRMAEKVNRLYFYDLMGAGLGCFLVVPLMPLFGGEGTVVVAAIFGSLSGIFFSVKRRHFLFIANGLVFIGLGLLSSHAEDYLKVYPHEAKRDFLKQAELFGLEFSKWSAISRIDVTNFPPYKMIWIDAGTNQSFLIPFNGKFDSLGPRGGSVALPYLLKDRVSNVDPDVMIIGPGGGAEVLTALAYKVSSLTAIEMDPVICDVVRHRFNNFIGGIYLHPNVKLINDEGRSFIRRSQKQYDIIQQVNNATPVAIASGGLNLSETYLLTKEAFHEYLDHLKDDGILAIHRWGPLRLLALALEVLEERQVGHPYQHIVIMEGEIWTTQGFYLKKTPFTQQELKFIEEFSQASGFKIIFSPNMRDPSSLSYKLTFSPDRGELIRRQKVNLFAPTDDKPFFDHFQKMGFKVNLSGVPEELRPQLIYGNIADLTLFAILGEAVVLSTFFIFLPLYIFRRKGLRAYGAMHYLGYFSALGLGFILVEICLIQKFILFIGYPVYSMATVLSSLLVSAGVGSYLSGKFIQSAQKRLAIIVIGIAALIIFELTLSPRIFHLLLGVPLILRIVCSVGLIAPLGILMGMPFPLGISLVHRTSSELIPWAWGINGYATVVGSPLCLILAITVGFKFELLLAGVIYILGLVVISRLMIPEKG